jgi:hypothetical protein
MTFSHYFLVHQVQEQASGNIQRAAKKKKAAPKCSLGGHPTKGHKQVSTCPKNQKKTIVSGISVFLLM